MEREQPTSVPVQLFQVILLGVRFFPSLSNAFLQCVLVCGIRACGAFGTDVVFAEPN